jgi:hypothetical protein
MRDRDPSERSTGKADATHRDATAAFGVFGRDCEVKFFAAACAVPVVRRRKLRMRDRRWW